MALEILSASARVMLRTRQNLKYLPIKSSKRWLSCGRSPVLASLKAEPQVGMFDTPTSIYISEVKPVAPVTIKLETTDYKGVKYASCGHYVSTAAGGVDVDRSISIGGSYEGRFPSGLMSTLKAQGHGNRYKRLQFQDIHKKPQTLSLSIHEGHNTIENCGSSLSQIQLERHFLGPGVTRVEVEDGRVRGVLFVPPGPGPHPAIIDMFGGAAVMTEMRSALLASYGFMSLSLPYFSYRDLQNHLETMELDYFEEAVEYILSQPNVIPDRCGVVAICQGGSYGLLMGTYIDKVKSVFLINTPSMVFGSKIFYKGKHILDGVELSSDNMVFDNEGRAILNYEKCKEWSHVDSRYTIPIELSSPDTYYSINVGEQDSFHASVGYKVMKQRLDRAGMKNNFEYNLLEGAGHIIEPPYSATVEQVYQGFWPNKGKAHQGAQKGIYLKWGGSPVADARAQVRTWNDMKNFLRYGVRDKSEWYQNYLKQSLSRVHHKPSDYENK